MSCIDFKLDTTVKSTKVKNALVFLIWLKIIKERLEILMIWLLRLAKFNYHWPSSSIDSDPQKTEGK